MIWRFLCGFRMLVKAIPAITKILLFKIKKTFKDFYVVAITKYQIEKNFFPEYYPQVLLQSTFGSS